MPNQNFLKMMLQIYFYFPKPSFAALSTAVLCFSNALNRNVLLRKSSKRKQKFVFQGSANKNCCILSFYRSYKMCEEIGLSKIKFLLDFYGLYAIILT